MEQKSGTGPLGGKRRSVLQTFLKGMSSVRKKRVSQKVLSIVCALSMVLAMVPAAWAASSFSDVREGQWFKPYVDKAVDAGLLNGMGDGRFDPNGNLTLAK